MNARPQLDQYLAQARRRLRWILSAHGAGVLAAALLLITLIAAWMLPRYGFTDRVAMLGRIALGVAAVAVAAWSVWRWRMQERGAGAAALERALPAQSGRIATYLQESAKEPGKASILLDLLAADALATAEREALERTIRTRRIVLPAAGAVAGVAILGALFFLGSGIGEGARQLWLGKLPPAASVAAAAGGIAVQPGNATVRRNQDLPVSALIAGTGGDAQLHLRFDRDGEWEVAPMERRADGGYDFTIYAVREGASYYVTAGRLRSAEHRITVVDLPSIEDFKLTYVYPGWTGLADLEQEGGDVRAVEGTRVNLAVTTSAPLEGPLLVVDGDGQELNQSGNTTKGGFAVKKDGHYRIATRFLGEVVPLTPDYFIEVVEDQKPNVKIARPGRDYRATAIEEVPVRVEAQDDFRLEALELHYSVNGGAWQKEPLPAGSPDIQAAAMLRLEEMQQRGPGGEAPALVPGDLVSYYALARDRKHSVQTDLFLIQVQPFEQRYTQSAAGGGGGGGGGGEEDEGNISRKQREILLATWNLQRNEGEAGQREKERVADNARMLAEVQRTLAEQARTLIQRTQSRQLTGQDRNVDTFVKAVQEAAKAMDPAARSLADMQLTTAVTHEQQALQHLLRAEAAFRDIEVAMQQRGGGGGGGSQASRDVSEMTELELDLAKNQYETESRMSSPQQRGQVEDEAMRRLRELARRQEQLARQAQRQQIPPEQQRWQQEQLRREAEELRRQLEQLAQQNQQGGQQQDGQQSGQQQSGQQQGGQQGRQQQSASSGSQSGNERQSARAASAAEAARQVAEATRQMGGDAQSQARASEQLNRAREQLERGQQQAGAEQFQALADRARQLAEQQRSTERDLRAATGGARPPSSLTRPEQRGGNDTGMSFEQMQRLAQEKREIQGGLEQLQREMDNTRRTAAQDAPRAARDLAEARRELQQQDLVYSLGQSARQIERGRGRDAANREPLITDTLDRLARNLESISQTASGESGRRQQQANQATAEDLLAELGDLRRMLENQRDQQQQALSQARTGGDPNSASPNAQEGQQGQQGGGQQGEQGQGGQGQQGQQGEGQRGQQGGSPSSTGSPDGGGGGAGRFGSGDDRLAGNGRLFGGEGNREPVPIIGQAERRQQVISADRLEQIRAQLREGVLTQADVRTLQELSRQLRRGGADPMNVEYQRMAALVNQLELAALRSQGTTAKDSTRATEAVDDSRQYRDNVAEYYRRLGGGND